MTTVRQAIVNFTIQQPTNFSSPARLRNLAYFCQPKTDITDEYVLVTSADDINTYTSDTRIADAFTNGLNQVYLCFEGNITDFTELSSLAYTLIASPDTDTVNTDFSTFEGLKSYTQENPESLILPTESNVPEKLAAVFKNNVFYATESESGSVKVWSQFISDTLNPNWNSMQLKEFGDETALCTNGDDVLKVREKQFSSFASDNDVAVPILVYFRAGGYNVADYYIVENLRQDMQTATMNYIANHQPRYTNIEIGNIKSIGQTIIDGYKNRGMIEDAVYEIPQKAEQTTEDIIDGLVNNLTLTVTVGGAIWAIKGTVIEIIGASNG